MIVAAVIGVCFGSFGNVLIERLPSGESILGRSRCDGCRRVLLPFELIPLLSWVLLRGRCRTCKERISLRVPLLEIVSGFLGVIALAHANEVLWIAIPFFLALWSLLLIAIIDLRTQTIPDILTFVAFVSALVYQWFSFHTIPAFAPVLSAAFFAVQWLVSRGRWVGMGDVLLAAACGMLVGTPAGALWLLLIAYAFGASIAITLLALGKLKRRDMIPFGPFLVFAAYCVLLLGEQLPTVPLA